MMHGRFQRAICIGATFLAAAFLPAVGQTDDPPSSQSTVQQHAEEAFRRLDQQRTRTDSVASEGAAMADTADSAPRRAAAPPDAENGTIVGHGQGDLSKGRLVCQRVAELAARADIAKQIRVLVKEHATDRIRERTGREPEQDLEVVREEIVQEYLQGVKIVDLRFTPETGSCSATAIMRNRPIVASPSPAPAPTAVAPR